MAGRRLLMEPWRTSARAAPVRAACRNMAAYPMATLSCARQAAGRRWQTQAGERPTPWLHRLLSGGNRRSMSQSSSEAASELPSMEKVLRSLYMRVHPDLFTSFPAARAQNEEGLKVLSEFLETTKDDAPPSKHKNFAIEFKMKPERVEDDSGESIAELTEKDLRHVSATLRSSGNSSASERNAQLARLFEACGLETRFKGSGGGGGTRGGVRGGIWVSGALEEFLALNKEAAAQAQADADDVWREIYAHQHALRMREEIRVTFQVSVLPAQRLDLLKQLQHDSVLAAFQKVELDRRVCILADRSGLDVHGRVLLDFLAGADEWATHVGGLKWEAVDAQRARLLELRDVEMRAAESLGLSFVHAAPDVESGAEYASLLEALLKRAPRQPSAPRGRASAKGSGSGAVLLVCSTAPESEGEEGGEACGVEASNGTLWVAVACDVGSVVRLVAERGYEAAERRRGWEERRRHVSDMLIHARQAVCASGLEVDWGAGVSEEEVFACSGAASRDRQRVLSARQRRRRGPARLPRVRGGPPGHAGTTPGSTPPGATPLDLCITSSSGKPPPPSRFSLYRIPVGGP
ncbi:hypothetical protein T484DRAFT_1914810 [Baffinella frigidus]|nr:hypothetical protein T484DRAFT_1914810 [Cryptophyta sp. CCMP2293]